MDDEFKNAWHHVRGITSEEMRQAALEAEREYGDILYLSRPVSAKHPPLSMEQKAAQYNPFAALTGYDDAIEETGRLTRERLEPDEDRKEELDRKLQMVREQITEGPQVMLTFFMPDLFKEGGEYVTVTGFIKKIDEYRHRIILTDGRQVPLDDIYDIMICEL